ncbi:MAG: tyrosine-type recombinase/integrase [Boseongicola sp. SB0662_bin_57]|nr:tyrosine-type recombinase/integrase [Boseongicola sp. SB0662_bin_57]
MAIRKRVRLTDAGIARLRPREREFTVWDSRVPGLGVRVRLNGGRSYVLIRTVEGRTRRLSLGATESKGVDQARHECLEMQVESRGELPEMASVQKAPLFRDFVAGAWHEAHFARYKPSSRRSLGYVLSARLLPAFGATELDRITGRQVERWFEEYSQDAPGGANRAMDLLRQILNFGIACGHMEKNPARGITRNRRTPMTRFLSRDEVRRLHEALDAADERGPGARAQADIIRLLLLTGARKGEIVNLRWSEVDGDALALTDSKTGPRTVHLNPQARAVLDRRPRGPGPWVFPSPADPDRPRSDTLGLWRSVRKEAGLDDVRLHDLRHNYASWAVMNGVPVPVVSRLLGHSSTRMTLRYVHLDDRDVRAAAERVGEAMAKLMAGTVAGTVGGGGA